jgi:hypothetical protein
LLLGAAANPLPDSPQPVVALSGVVRAEELAEMRIVFETILRTLHPARHSSSPADWSGMG